MFSSTEIIVTQIVMKQYIVASLSLSVISQRPIYQNSWLRFRSKSFSSISSAMRFLRLLENNSSSAEHWFYPCRTKSDQQFGFL